MEHFRIFDDTIVYLLLVAKELMRKCRFSCNLTNNCITKLLVYLLYIYFKLHDFAVNINLNTNLSCDFVAKVILLQTRDYFDPIGVIL